MTEDDVRRLVDEPAARGEVTAVALATTFLERLDASQPILRTCIRLMPERALVDAAAVDAARAAGTPLPLDGLPLVVKDNIDVAGVPTTVGSRLYADRPAATLDAEVVRRLREAGAIVLAKANLHELAFGATSQNEAFGAVVNPLAPDRIPGGSSGGSAAAVAADLCVAALGSDTGGSIRLPASACGVTGHRPTVGAVPNRGVHAVCAALDTVGPLARAATDVRSVLAAVAGHDPLDPTSLAGKLDVSGVGVAGARVGVVDETLDGADPSVVARLGDVVEALGQIGVLCRPVSLPGWAHAADVCGRLIRAEAFLRYREDLATTPEAFEPGNRKRLALGASGLEPHDAHAQARWRSELEGVWEHVDVLLLPTIPVELPPVDGATTVETTAAVVPATFPLALAGVPALSLCCGTDAGGGPVGAQLAAAAGRDGLVLAVTEAIQSVTAWHRARHHPPTT